MSKKEIEVQLSGPILALTFVAPVHRGRERWPKRQQWAAIGMPVVAGVLVDSTDVDTIDVPQRRIEFWAPLQKRCPICKAAAISGDRCIGPRALLFVAVQGVVIASNDLPSEDPGRAKLEAGVRCPHPALPCGQIAVGGQTPEESLSANLALNTHHSYLSSTPRERTPR